MTPKKVRGTATIYADGDIDFRAQGEGKPQKRVLQRQGNSQLYETTSEHSPKLCAHLMADRDDPSAPRLLQAQLDDFLQGFGSQQKELLPVRKDTVLWDADGLRVWYRKQHQDIAVTLTLPADYEEKIQRNALRKLQNLYQCFTINKQFLARVVSARVKTL